MSTISTFGTFGVARLGIYVAQKALDITGNNISNINNPKYTRQALDISSLIMNGSDRYANKYDQRIGAGAIAVSTSQMRDPYLDIRYRTENSSVGAMDAKLAGLDELASTLDEVFKGKDGEGVIEAQFNDLISQLQNAVTDGAGINSFETLFRSSASSLTGLFHDYADKLETLRNNMEDGLAKDVDTVNGILTSIRELNASIRKSEIHGAEALEQKDERNALIDELSNYIRIDVTYEKEVIDKTFAIDKLVIKIRGDDTVNKEANNATLVDGLYATQLSIKQQEARDANGEPIYKKDSNGNLMFDDQGKRIPVMEYVPNYDISLDPLKDKNGLRMILTSENATAYWPYTVGDSTATPPMNETDAENALKDLKERNPDAFPAEDVDGNKLTYIVKETDTTGVWQVMQVVNGETEAAAPYSDPSKPITLLPAPTKEEAESALNALLGKDPYPEFVTADGITVRYTYAVTGDKPKTVEDGNSLWTVKRTAENVVKAEPATITGTNFQVPTDAEAVNNVAQAMKNLLIAADQNSLFPATAPDGTDYTYSIAPDGAGGWKVSQTGKDGTNGPSDYTELNKHLTTLMNQFKKDGDTEYMDSLQKELLAKMQEADQQNKYPISGNDKFGTPLTYTYGDATFAVDPTDNTKVTWTIPRTVAIGTPADTDADDVAVALSSQEEAMEKLEKIKTTLPTEDAYGNLISYQPALNDNGSWGIVQTRRMPSQKVELADNTLYGALQSEREMLTEQGEYSTAEQIDNDPKAPIKRGIPYYQKVMDSLVNHFANMMNEANRPYAIVVRSDTKYDPKKEYAADDIVFEKDGKDVRLVLEEKNDKMYLKLEGETQPDDLDLEVKDGKLSKAQFEYIQKNLDLGQSVLATEKLNTDKDYYPTTGDNRVPLGRGDILFSNNGNGNDPTKITAANISVAYDWSHGFAHLLQSKNPHFATDQSTANDNLDHFLYLLDADQSFTPDSADLDTGSAEGKKVFFTGSFQEFYSNHIAGTLATDQKTTTAILSNYAAQLDELYVDRDSVSGVDLNDETMNMIQYQKSYSAACRLMTTIDEMLDKLINGTGRAGL